MATKKKSTAPTNAIKAAPLMLGGIEMDCAVLPDGVRVLSRRSMLSVFKRAVGGKQYKAAERGGVLGALLMVDPAIKGFVSEDLGVVYRAISYVDPRNGKEALGIDATALPRLCSAWLAARRAGALKTESQARAAEQAEIINDALATIGIVAMIDEATGFQRERAPDALQQILDLYLLPYMARWAKRFPDEFYERVAKLKGWKWEGRSKNPPQVMAHWTRDLIYMRMPPGINRELDQRMPVDEDGRKVGKLHQLFTPDVGHPALQQHISNVITLLRASSSWRQFIHMMDAAFPKRGDTLMLPGMTGEAGVPEDGV
jgi:hypothetical protein